MCVQRNCCDWQEMCAAKKKDRSKSGLWVVKIAIDSTPDADFIKLAEANY